MPLHIIFAENMLYKEMRLKMSFSDIFKKSFLEGFSSMELGF